ncbi:hypothetical protein KGF86_01295 [Ornithinibacillus massiliensis]|uniref:DUF3139 domain-containing protein n=1 Tax=Ornithinibacillus massiliensis TaxID=1944633 RepID=A0ABS5M939_9BACI|nr:hypothetical protein [Ornithinibacillus massiliensis]MBS3678841.1 hypothetical protein [Ornithinibacillus massiliensis]
MLIKRKTPADWIWFFVFCFIIVGGSVFHVLFFTPKNSLEMYQELHFADSFEDVQSLILDGYENNFTEEDFTYIQANTANRVGQFTLMEFGETSYVIMTSPGTERLKILAVEALPEDVREFFLELGTEEF